MKKWLLLLFFMPSFAWSANTCGPLVINPTTGKLDCIGSEGYALQPATVTPNFALGLSATTGVFTSTVQIGITLAAPASPSVTLHYGAGGNGDYFALGNSFGFFVVPYKIVNGVKTFGTGTGQFSLDDNNSANNLWVTFAWTAVTGADGYRVFIQDTYYMHSNYDAYYDTTLTEANIGKAGAPPAGGVENDVTLGTTQTPLLLPLIIDPIENISDIRSLRFLDGSTQTTAGIFSSTFSANVLISTEATIRGGTRFGGFWVGALPRLYLQDINGAGEFFLDPGTLNFDGNFGGDIYNVNGLHFSDGTNQLTAATSGAQVYPSTSNVMLTNGVAWAVTTINQTAFTVVSTHTVILASATVTGSTLTLPSPSLNTGIDLWIKKIDLSTQTITISPNGSELIDSSTQPYRATTPNESHRFTSDGTNWWTF